WRIWAEFSSEAMPLFLPQKRHYRWKRPAGRGDFTPTHPVFFDQFTSSTKRKDGLFSHHSHYLEGVPEGRCENSPARSAGKRFNFASSAVGTAEMYQEQHIEYPRTVFSIVPTALNLWMTPDPALPCWAIFMSPLRGALRLTTLLLRLSIPRVA